MTTIAATSLEERLKRVIGNIRNLPTPPIVFEQIQKVINNPETSVGDIAKILSEDPAMSVKVLKLTNSAFYGLSREVESVQHAVMLIGLEAVKNLVLSASVLSMFKADKDNKEYHENFWRHSLATALAARVISREYKNGEMFNPDPAFSSGLIHDIGKMIICCFMPEEHKLVIKYLKEHPDASELEAEVIEIGFNHAQLGRQLATTWKLPGKLADTIGFHHNPDMKNQSDNLAYLISLADYAGHVGFPGADDTSSRAKPHPETLKFFNIDKTFIEQLKGKLIEEYMRAETFMSIAEIST